ncbi:TonB-dependent receptor [Sphingopyxis sp.]|uniref:TonB-dependent receptor domain-containing protein n=1 Tax=Sphingopyxis sp. TaxID=1908224 RepID=UPI0025D1F231|nr:TonB-dependent receptor [Sphingopyxis sp.]MBK6412701.1 TonB-dependent receptor [Sphingopyxis sp.]
MTAIAWNCPPADAREPARQTIDIPATTLPRAIGELSREAGVSIGMDGLLPNLRTPAIHGRLTVDQALARLLAGTAYIARRVGDNAWRIESRPAASAAPPTVVDNKPRNMDDPGTIIVTATKREAPLANLPLAVSVYIPSASDAMDPASDTARVASAVDGFSATGLGPGGTACSCEVSPTARLMAKANRPWPSSSMAHAHLFGARSRSSACRRRARRGDQGPQGSLYGTGALGGTYHIVTRRPDTESFAASMTGGATLVSGGGTGLSGSAIVNLPLVRGTAALRLVGYRTDEPGWIDTGSRRNANRTRVEGARAALGVELGDRWRLDLSGLVQFLGSRDSQYVYAPGARARAGQRPEPHDNDLSHMAARLTRDGDVAVELVSGMTWHEVDDRLDATIGASQFGLANPLILSDDRQYRVLDNELRVSSDRGPIRWLVGLSHVQARQEFVVSLASDNAELLIDDDRRTTSDLALFGDVGFALAPTVSLEVGGRAFHTRVSESRLAPLREEYQRVRRTGFTPSAALSWRPRSDTLIYLRYGSAVRQGGSDINSVGQLELLKGDELQTLEAGWREQLGGGQLDAGVWYSRWDHIQSDLLESDGLIETRNAGEGRIFGADASLSLPLTGGWKLDSGASLVSARLVRNDLGIALDDRRLPVIPSYVVRAALSHDFEIGSAAASLALRLRYIGPSRLSFDPLVDRPMGKLIEGGLEAHLALDSFNLTASVENLFGEDEDSFAFGNSLRFATMRQYIPMAPRQVSVALSAIFAWGAPLATAPSRAWRLVETRDVLERQ